MSSFVAVQIALLVILVPLVYTTPPDPLWISGIYDEADQDEVVGLLTDDGWALADEIATGVQPVLPESWSVHRAAESLIIASLCSTLHLRSPPSR